ncbi:M4 family metallopeptidase, partial [Candidatus Poribacteria bacterium]|nr:M4 family metallopeptidase [Candidatus Poribacteria bacterium]
AVYRWDTMFEEMLPAGQSWRPTAELMVYEHQGQFRLVYRTMIAIEEPEPANWVYFIDARTGAVVHRYNDLKHTDAVGTGHSLYRGTVSINTNLAGSTFEMKDNPRNLWTYDARNRRRLPGVLFTDADNVWGDGTKSNPQTAGVDAHWGAATTYDYYLNTHSRDSFDDAGARITSTVHYRRNYVNAFWNGQQVVYGDGDGSTADPLVDLDVVSHELTHAVTQYTANLIYQDQSGALNESTSDVFAMMVDTDDFTIGEDSWTPGVPGDALRYMDDPPKGGQPNHMEDFLVTDEDNGGVHTNSGIPNFAAYLATAGGVGKKGDVVTGIGRSKVEGIWYRALSVYMTPSTDFMAARLTTAQAATDLYGGGSPEVQTIEDAWTAVGVVISSASIVSAAPIRPGLQVTLDPLQAEPQFIPLVTRAFQNYPNPFNPETWLPYQLAKPAHVVIRIYDVQGRLVRTLDLGEQPPGVYLEKSRAAYWDGRNHLGEVVPGGVYFYTLQAGAFQATRKLVILK